MRNLARLTWRAQENAGVKRDNRRAYPKCAIWGCKKRVELRGDGAYTEHCYLHRTEDEYQAYKASWQARLG